jgi:hypothetical protein
MPTPILSKHIAGPFRAYFTPPIHVPPAAYSVGTRDKSTDYLGVIGDGGVREVIRYEMEDFNADIVGNTVVDSVYLGGQCFLEFTLEEVDFARVNLLAHVFSDIAGALSAGVEGQIGIPGQFASYRAGKLTLSPENPVGTAALTSAGIQATPQREYGLSVLAAGFELTKLLASKRRNYAIRLRCFPYETTPGSGIYVWYEKTAIVA